MAEQRIKRSTREHHAHELAGAMRAALRGVEGGLDVYEPTLQRMVEAAVDWHMGSLAVSADTPMAWVTDYDTASTVDKNLFSDPSIGNCPGCSNVRWHAKRCPWVAGYRAAAPVPHPAATDPSDGGGGRG